MNITILQLIEGAKKAKGLTVIIDVFRAFSFEAYLFANCARVIYPIGNAEKAYELKRKNPEVILAGERHGEMLPNFDTGNSPSELYKLDVKDKIIIHTTSAGTQGVVNANNATEILGASLVNAKATAKYIFNSGADEVSLCCMGLEGKSETDEDTLCARYIKSILEGTTMDMFYEIEKLKRTSGAKFFDKTQNKAFPEKDFYLCTDLDRFDFLIRLNKEKGLGFMEKIII